MQSPGRSWPTSIAQQLPATLDRRAPWIVVGLTLLGAGLRLYRLENSSVWFDEGASVYPARLPFWSLLQVTATNVHPPVYYLLLKFWRPFAGDSEFSLRLLSVFAGVLLLPLAYRFVRRLAGTPAALLAAALLSLSRVLVWQAQEIRFYTLTPLLALVSLVLAVRLWQGGGWKYVVGHAVVTALGLLTLYLFVGVPLAENLALLIVLPWLPGRRLATFLKWIAAQGLILLLFAPWLLYALPRLPGRSTPAAPLGAWDTAKLYFDTLLVGDPNNIGRFWPFILAGLLLLAAGLALALRGPRLRSPRHLPALAALLIGPLTSLGLVWLLNLPLPLHFTFTPEPRYFVTQLPWALILLAIALAALWQRWPKAGWAAAALVLGGFTVFAAGYYDYRYLADDYVSAAGTLRAYRQPGDAFILHNDQGWPVVAYHTGNDFIGVNSGQRIANAQDAAAYTEPAWDTHDGVWLLVTPEALLNDPDHNLYNWLASRAMAQREFDYDPTAQLFFFARTAARAASIDQLAPAGLPRERLSFAAAPGLTLLQASWALPEYKVGDTLRLFLYWRNANAPGLYTYQVQLVTGGVIADQVTAALPVTADSPGLIRQQVDIPVHVFLSSGTYSLVLVAGSAWTSLGQLPVIGLPIGPPLADVPAQAATASFQNGIKLLGDTLTPGPGGQLTLQLYWTATAPIDKSYKAFVHLQGPATNPATGNSYWAQDDHAPNLGGTPTSTWRVGQTVRDTFQLHLPANAPAGSYVAQVGWYDFLTGERLLVLDDTGQAVDSQVSLAPVTLDPAR